MTQKSTDCKDVMKHVCESLGEDLNSDRCVAIKEHLDNCDGCKNYFKTVELTIEYYKSYNVDLPNDAHNKLMKFLDLEE